MTAAACHPGEVLAQKLEALGVTPTELARQLHVPANRMTQIVNGKRAVTGDSALRLARWFGEDPEQWMALQARYDLEVAKIEAGREIADLPTRPYLSASAAKRETKPVQGRTT
jgi:addiction module HigA family antidote